MYFFPIDSFSAVVKRFGMVAKKKKKEKKKFISPQEISGSAIWHPSQPLRTSVLAEAAAFIDSPSLTIR